MRPTITPYARTKTYKPARSCKTHDPTSDPTMAHKFAFLLFPFLFIVSHAANSLMVPAFIWSSSPRCVQDTRHDVDYQIFSAEGLSNTVLQQISHFNKMCPNGNAKVPEVAVIFIGNEMHTKDVAQEGKFVPNVRNVLQGLISASTFSLSLPYVVRDGKSLRDIFMKELKKEYDSLATIRKVVTLGCSGEYDELNGASVLKETEKHILDMGSKVQSDNKMDVLVVCQDQPLESEEKLLNHVLHTLEASNLHYVASYMSDPLFTAKNSRELIVSALANNETSPYCDSICQSKATLLEALFVSIVVIIILVSGLCCMMGIQAPSRFESPHES